MIYDLIMKKGFSFLAILLSSYFKCNSIGNIDESVFHNCDILFIKIYLTKKQRYVASHLLWSFRRRWSKELVVPMAWHSHFLCPLSIIRISVGNVMRRLRRKRDSETENYLIYSLYFYGKVVVYLLILWLIIRKILLLRNIKKKFSMEIKSSN